MFKAIDEPGEKAALTIYTIGYRTPMEHMVKNTKTIMVLRLTLALALIYSSPSLKDLVRLRLKMAIGARTIKIITASTDA